MAHKIKTSTRMTLYLLLKPFSVSRGDELRDSYCESHLCANPCCVVDSIEQHGDAAARKEAGPDEGMVFA